MHSFRRFALVGTVVLASCDTSGPVIEPPRPLAVLTTPAPTDTAAAEPIQALVVAVRSPTGEILPNAAVRFIALTVTRNGLTTRSMFVGSTAADFAPAATLTTNDRGRAIALIKFGPVAGPAGIEITVPEFGLVDTVRFTVIPGAAAGLRLEPQDTALAIGSTLTIKGGVVDQWGNTRADPIVFTATAIPANAGTVSATGQVTATAAGQISVTGTAGGRVHSISVSVVPSGTIAGFDGTHFVLVNLDGSGRRNITQAPITPGPDFEPAWARDGSAIVYTAGGKLAVLTVATGAIVNLMAMPEPYWPTFSPDGRQVYFSVSDGSARIARIDRDGTNFTIVTAGPFDSRASFAPDGKTFIYHSYDGELKLTKYSLVSNSVVPTTVSGIFPEWSPVGDQIVYFTPSSELRIMDGDGSNDRSLAPPGYYNAGQTSWAPDGRWLLLQRNGIELLGIGDDVKGITVRPAIALSGAIWRP